MDKASEAALVVLRQQAQELRNAKPESAALKSIFSELWTKDDGKSQPPAAFFAARPFAINDATLFPKPDLATAQAAADPAMLQQFAAAYAALGDASERTLEQLYYLLQEYAWAIPSPKDQAVSLFDHARTEAALAAARSYGQPNDDVLLVGGDISGVQSFLYTLTAAGATKSLRARSFYLQMLTDALAHYLLTQAKMPITNVLYSGGGRFYIILPGSAISEITRWRGELGQLMLRRHAGELYVAIGGITFDQATLADSVAFGQQWRSLNEAVNTDKRRRFAALDPHTLFTDVFTPQGHGGDTKAACVVCRYQGEANEFDVFEPDIESNVAPVDQRNICKLCNSFSDLAKDLHNAQYLILTPVASQLPNRRERIDGRNVLEELGLHISVTHTLPSLQHSRAADPPLRRVLSMQNPVPLAVREQWASHPIVFGLRPVVNVVPTIRQQDLDDPRIKSYLDDIDYGDEQPNRSLSTVKTFGLLVRQSEGVKRLGVLRMDVDDLGDLFAHSVRGVTLARIGSLSAALVRFFEGWVGYICRDTNQKYGERVYAVYSGGDDLFLVGAWDVMPELARRISTDLRKYALNERVHLSAGLSLHGAKFPLYQAAEAAHEELDRAKGRPGKNALGFLEQIVGWDMADEVYQLQSQFTQLILSREHHLTASVLQVVQAIYSQYLQPPKKDDQRKKAAGTFFFGSWIWHGVYQLARMADERHSDKEVYKLLNDIRNNLTSGAAEPALVGSRYIERVALAARWAQLELRKEQS